MFTEPNDPPTTALRWLDEMRAVTESDLAVREDGTKEWRDQEGRLHRVGDPAVIFPDGTKMWFQYGVLHRGDGPAMVFPDGTQYWCQYDALHRDDGPAVVRPDGRREWRIHGLRVDPPTFEGPTAWVDWQWIPHDPPTGYTPDRTQEWRDQEGRLHRDWGEPASVVSPDGTAVWYWHGMLHRDDGPAMVFPDGSERWWIDGSRVDPPQFDGPVRWDKTARTWVPQD